MTRRKRPRSSRNVLAGGVAAGEFVVDDLPSAVVGELTAGRDCGPQRARMAALPVAEITNWTGPTVNPCPAWKRAMDIVGALAALALLSPLLLAVAAMIKCVSRGPVLFRQRRYGVGGRPFMIWKFRTVRADETLECHQSHVLNLMQSDRPFEKRDRELAVIPGGAALRKLGLDELPQLVNVLRGEMSLVGPRPDVLPYESYLSWQRDRFNVLPGITGLWQVSGKNRTTFTTMIQLDIAYIRRRSLLLDLLILVRTIPAMLSS